MLIIPDHMIGAASELEDATHAKRFSRRDGARVRPFEQRKKASQHGRWSRGAAGYMEVDRDHLGNASDHGIAAGKTPSIPGAISDRNDPFGIGSRAIGALECFAHIPGHGAGHHQHIGMTWRSDEAKAEALDVVIGVIERVDLKLASIAGSGVDLTYRKAPAKTP